jgi:hypothetical protein
MTKKPTLMNTSALIAHCNAHKEDGFDFKLRLNGGIFVRYHMRYIPPDEFKDFAKNPNLGGLSLFSYCDESRRNMREKAMLNVYPDSHFVWVLDED